MDENKEITDLETKEQELQSKKRQIWLVLIIMLAAACIGLLVLFGILLLVLK